MIANLSILAFASILRKETAAETHVCFYMPQKRNRGLRALKEEVEALEAEAKLG